MAYEMIGPAITRMDVPEMWNVHSRYGELAEGFSGMELSEPSGYGQSQSVADQMTNKIKDAIKGCATSINDMNGDIDASIKGFEQTDGDNARQYGPVQEQFQSGGETS